jgi:hypothetical protein
MVTMRKILDVPRIKLSVVQILASHIIELRKLISYIQVVPKENFLSDPQSQCENLPAILLLIHINIFYNYN